MQTIKIFFVALFLLLPSHAYSATYYLDASAPDDNGTGGIGSPWKTLSRAQSSVASGDVVNILTGDYGGYSESNVARTDYVVYQAVNGATVHFDYISIKNTVKNQTYLKFSGINIKPDWVDPCATVKIGCDDPQYADADQGTYTKTLNPVVISNAQYIQIIDSKIEGQNRHLTDTGVDVENSADFLISGCDINNMVTPVHLTGEIDGGTLLKNHIHEFSGTAVSVAGTGLKTIEQNHIYDGVSMESDDYYPRASGYHSSGISIRNGNTVVRGNIIHNVGRTSGITLYEDETTDYVNEYITIESNVIYDIINVYAFLIYEAGRGVIIRNNTIVSQQRDDVSTGQYRFRTAFQLSSVDGQNGTPDLQIHNNIFIGIASGLSNQYVTESNNIVWSYYTGSEWLCTDDTGVGENTFVFTCTSGNNSYAQVYALFANDQNMTFVPNHGRLLNFTVPENSIAYNNGDATKQANSGVGILDGDGAFIVGAGISRSAEIKNIGAYADDHFMIPTRHSLGTTIFGQGGSN